MQQAIGIGGPITFLAKEEGEKINAMNNDPKNPAGGIMRPWELCKKESDGEIGADHVSHKPWGEANRRA